MQKFAFKIDIHHRPDVKVLLLNEMNLKKPLFAVPLQLLRFTCFETTNPQILILNKNKFQVY